MDAQEYADEVFAALRRTPERAARLAELEQATGLAETREELWAAGDALREALDVAAAEVNAVRKAEGRPVSHS